MRRSTVTSASASASTTTNRHQHLGNGKHHRNRNAQNSFHSSASPSTTTTMTMKRTKHKYPKRMTFLGNTVFIMMMMMMSMMGNDSFMPMFVVSAFSLTSNPIGTKSTSSSSITRQMRGMTTTTTSTSTTTIPTTTTTALSMMGEMEEVECDVVIIGGGPAGCTCALYTARADLSTVILDKNPAVGALAITSHIANYPGVDKSMTGMELLDQMRKQAIDYGTDYRRAQVFMIDIVKNDKEDKDKEEEDDGSSTYSKIVYTPEGIFKARSLVLASGAMGRVSPPFPGEDTYLGQGVSYCATCDGAFYRDSEVAVYGMNLEAMEEATFLTKFASTVHWVTPSAPRAEDDEHVQELLNRDNVKHWPLTRLIEVEGDASGVTGIQVKRKDCDETEVIPVEGAFIYAAGGGSKPITDFVGSMVEYKEDGGVVVNEDMETSVKGVFAIGDIRNTAFKQVVVASADGCIAAMSIDKYLKGRKSVKVDWIHK